MLGVVDRETPDEYISLDNSIHGVPVGKSIVFREAEKPYMETIAEVGVLCWCQ